MGEARTRRDSDPFFGRHPKLGRGIIVSPPVTIDEYGRMIFRDAAVDPIELRRAALFWDRINKPRHKVVSSALSADEEFLKQCGILSEVNSSGTPPAHTSFADIYKFQHFEAFRQLEEKEPGLWCMSEGSTSFNLISHQRERFGRGVAVTLYRAIPLPTADTPLEEILNFKEKRRDELLSLTLEMDGLFSRISSASDQAFELQRAIAEIDKRCRDVIEAGREAKFQFSLSELTYGVSLECSTPNVLLGGILGSLAGSAFELGHVAAAIGAAAATLKFNLSFGGKLKRLSKDNAVSMSPYRVVGQLLNEPL